MPQPPTLRVRADLDHLEPPVWRRFLVSADASLADLHELLQGAFGWQDCHLHEFRQGARRFAMRGGPDDLPGEDEAAVTVGELLHRPGDLLEYRYDFGDDWGHSLKLEAVLPPEDDRRALPRVIGGACACPPEDCGGPPGFHAFQLEPALGGPGPTVFDPRAFDLAEADARVAWLRGDPAHRREASLRSATTPDLPPALEDATWSPLEEQLGWRRLEDLLAAPEWREAAEEVRVVFDLALSGSADPAQRAALLEDTEVARLRADFLACDLLREQEPEAVIPALLESPQGRDLPAGCLRFLTALLDTYLGLYEIDEVHPDGSLLLFDWATTEPLEASPPAPGFAGRPGELLISRLLPGRDGLPRLRGALLAPFDEDATSAFVLELAQGCLAAGGDADDPVQLLKPSAPLLLVHWARLAHGHQARLPLALRPGEDWEPGLGEYLLPPELDEDELAERLDAHAAFGALDEDLWFLAPGAAADREAGLPRGVEGWVKLEEGCVFLFAGGRLAMQRLRRALKRAAGPGLRHHATRYDPALELPVSREDDAAAE